MTSALDLPTCLLIGRLYVTASTSAYEQTTVSIAPCSRCGADVDQQCIGQYRRPTRSMHAARIDAANDWQLGNQADYQAGRTDLLRSIFRELLQREGLL